MPSKPTPDRFLSAYEVAILIGLHHKTIRNGECGTNELIRIKLGHRVVFSENNVREWMARKVKEAEADKQREHSAVIDLFTHQRRDRDLVRDTADQVVNEERRRWER